MDWKQILSVSPENMDDDKKDELFEEIIFIRDYDKIDGKSYKKLFKLSQHILKYKGDQVVSLLSELDTLATKQGEMEALNSSSVDFSALNSENNKLRKIVEKMEAERIQFKSKVKELTDEIGILQKKYQDSHFGSEREDSPDALSDIDRQQELLNNISTKNKHIKRLLRDIDSLENRTTEQRDIIDDLRSNLSDATFNLTSLTNKCSEAQVQISDQNEIIQTLNAKIINIEEMMEVMQKDVEEREQEINEFGKQLEDRAITWRNILDEKQSELDSLRLKYDDVVEQNPGYNIDSERAELKRLGDAIKERDSIIQELEAKLLEITNEMIRSTEFMNRLSKEKELTNKDVKIRNKLNCCNELKTLFGKSTARTKELEAMLLSAEEDNILKSKQALEAIEALHGYETGQDGLPQALKKITELQYKINSRDKQIRALIMELNSFQDIATENIVLRKRLGIPEDDNVSLSNFTARQRKFQKLNERLTLKLRASEEMRLQLKLEKNDLKRKISCLNSRTTESNEKTTGIDVAELLTGTDAYISDQITENVKFCENCLKSYKLDDFEKCETCKLRDSCNYCETCQKKLKITTSHDEKDCKAIITKLENNYSMVVEENENLRIGMHEILHKIRDYDATSDHITVDSSTLEKLLHALDARSISGWYHPAMRMQNELLASKEREYALKERMRLSENILIRQKSSQENTDVLEQQILDSSKSAPIATGTMITTCEMKEESSQTDFIDKNTDINHETYSDIIINKENEIQKLNEKLMEIAKELESKIIENDELKNIKNELNNLTNILNQSEQEKDIFLAKTTEEIINVRNDMNLIKRKFEFLLVDYENLNNSLKKIQFDHEKVIIELKKELTDKLQIIRLLESQGVDPLNSKLNEKFKHDIQNLQIELYTAKSEMSKICCDFLKNIHQIDKENFAQINQTQLCQFGVIDENFTVDYLTKEEYNDLKSNASKSQEELNNLRMKIKYFEDILKLTQDQIKEQQEILSKYSDDEISLRHLVVDLQSNSNEKQLIARNYREIENLKNIENKLKKENENWKFQITELRNKLDETVKILDDERETSSKIKKNYDLKLSFLIKSLLELRQNYCKFTPMYSICDFVQMYTFLLEMKRKIILENSQQQTDIKEKEYEKFLEKIKTTIDYNELEDKINVEIVKYQTNCEYLQNQMNSSENKLVQLEEEVKILKLKSINSARHWNTLELLLTGNKDERHIELSFVDKEIQVGVETSIKSTNTEAESIVKQSIKHIDDDKTKSDDISFVAMKTKPDYQISDFDVIASNKALESQLKQAMILASTRSALLLETENRLTETQGRMKALEKNLEELKEERDKSLGIFVKSDRKDENILSITIASLQNLLLEKDTTLSRYQELLKTERQEHSKSSSDYQSEIKCLRVTMDDLNKKLQDKDIKLEEMNTKIKELETLTINKKNFNDEDDNKLLATGQQDDLLMELSDKFLDEMYLDEKKVFDMTEKKMEMNALQKRINEDQEEIKQLRNQLREVSNREKIWERSLNEKDKEIASLNERLSDLNDISDNIANRRDIEQLKEMLEEKDKHINDLTETLTHFHDDQQKFISDTSLHSAEQMSQLSADLNRTEATNKVLHTQIEALKRQITNLGQREKQARELVKTLKNQLIRRPVISIKNERAATREEYQQRRIQQLENDLTDMKEELRKQSALAESRRNKNASDLNLWEKQKRWQQIAEKQKIKLAEKETEIEKLKLNFNTAKNTITRLEREKHLIETRLKSSPGANHLCQSPSCPNLHHHHHLEDTKKYTPAESPESYSSESTDALTSEGVLAFSGIPRHHQNEIIDALKNRIELQQRKIVAMEFEGKGSNAVTKEIERLQEKISSLEAQNLRLEAKNLQLQLDYNLVKQGDESERQKRQIKHLEDYILVLKNELSQALANTMTDQPVSATKSSIVTNVSQMEQTILALKRIIERLKVENKNLREGKRFTGDNRHSVSKEIYDKMSNELEKTQNLYSEALDKISALQIDLELQEAVCRICKNRVENGKSMDTVSVSGFGKNLNNDGDGLSNELAKTRDKLLQKTELLEKAKILLTRAAAKEKNLREQIAFWKRRCSELQNVPTIEEASE